VNSRTKQQKLQIQENLFLYPTPAGAYHAVSSPQSDPARNLLRSLFKLRSSPLLNRETLLDHVDSGDETDILYLLKQMQDNGWLQGCEVAQHVSDSALEELLPDLLAPLSGRGSALLADNHGFHISHAGFNAEDVEQLSALSADVSILHEKHLNLLTHRLDLNSSSWAIVDAAGNSQTGFWPMHIGAQRFVLVIGGLPRLNQPVFTSLIWALSIRYGTANPQIR
jgi:hypothetical protein